MYPSCPVQKRSIAWVDFFHFKFPVQASGKLTITNVHVEGDPEYVKVAANLKNVNGRGLVSGDGYLLNDITGDVMISGVVSVLSNGHGIPLIRIEPISFCKFVTDKKKHPVLKFIYKMIQQYGKIPTSCPIKKVTRKIVG